MSPWFDVTSGLNFHPLAFMSTIAISSICEGASVCAGVLVAALRDVCVIAVGLFAKVRLEGGQ